MEAFIKHTGRGALLMRGNIDTDQIISKEHLKSIRRTGYGEHLFSDWRYLDNGQINPDFELNNPNYKDATVLIAGNNFGCGSSREHAVWAIVQYGFKSIIAPRRGSGDSLTPAFADIFRNNSTKNGLLLVELSEDEVNEIQSGLKKNPATPITIDLPSQKVTIGEKSYSFDIDSALKQKFLEGLDDIGSTEKYTQQISDFEGKHTAQLFS